MTLWTWGESLLIIHTSHVLFLCLSGFLSVCMFPSPQSLEITLKYCNYFFTSTFVLEAVLKLIAFGFRRFFKDRYSVHSPPHLSSPHGFSPTIANWLNEFIRCWFHLTESSYFVFWSHWRVCYWQNVASAVAFMTQIEIRLDLRGVNRTKRTWLLWVREWTWLFVSRV